MGAVLTLVQKYAPFGEDVAMEYHIFLSYRRSDQAIARAVVQELEARNVRVWWDQMIEGGEDWRDAIVEGLQGSASLVILFSEECNASKQLKKELAIADTLDKLVVPVLIEDTQPKGHYLYELSTRNWVQMFPKAETKAAKLADKLVSTLNGSGIPVETDSPADRLDDVVEINPVAASAPVPSAAPAPARREITTPRQPVKAKPHPKQKDKHRDFLPFKWLDIIPIVALFFGFFVMMDGLDDLSFDYPMELVGRIMGIGALMAAAYGAIVFPIRYFMRRRRVLRAAIMYVLSSFVLFFLFVGGLLAYYEGDLDYVTGEDLVIGLVIWAIMAAVAIVLYAILSAARAVRSFRKNVEAI